MKAIAQLASRICVVSMHTGEVYEASIRLHEQALLGPDVQKLVVETPRGKLVGILEFPGPGGPYPVVLVCHGIPSDKPLREGDIVNVDVTYILDGWHGDSSRMFAIGASSLAASSP